MDRLTKELGKGFYIVDDTKVQHDANGFYGEAVNILAKFENMYEDLIRKQGEITRELEKLRLEDKTHSVKFKQLLGNKLLNNEISILLRSYGLDFKI